MSTHADDLALARRIADGDSSAWEELLALYGVRLWRYAVLQARYCGEDAQDVLQEALTGAWRNIASYRGDASLYSWLCGIIWNKAADMRRREWRLGQVEERAERRAERERLEPWRERAERRLQRREQAAAVRQALDALPEHYRQVLELKYLQELPVEDIAQRMGRTFKSTESLLTRARIVFRAAYVPQ